MTILLMRGKKHIHFVGIAGSLMAPLAVALKRQGFRVTGSDVGFYPPMSSFLKKEQIEVVPGFNPDKFKHLGLPDMAVVMSFLTPHNPEVRYLRDKKVTLLGLGQLLQWFFIKDNSIVVAGNYGKTTISALLGWILEQAGFDPTVLLGGLASNFKSGVKVGSSRWSVSEGDEFKVWQVSRNFRFSRRARLLYQRPKLAILTDATWDHYDLYPTKREYLEVFQKFVKLVPADGLILGFKQGKHIPQILQNLPVRKKCFLSLETKDLQSRQRCLVVSGIKFLTTGVKFSLRDSLDKRKIGEFKVPLYGSIGIIDAGLAAGLAYLIGVEPALIGRALKSFKGVKRRLEVRLRKNNLIIIDDFAHSPVKLQGVLGALRQHFRSAKIILVYQPGSKDKKALRQYTLDTWVGADFIVLPRISSLNKESRRFNSLLAAKLKDRYPVLERRLRYIEDDKQLVNFVVKKANQFKKHHRTIILFAAQKGWRGLLEAVIQEV